VARRESKGFVPRDVGTTYDIISKMCDHELAEIITSKMRKHEKDKEKEKEQDTEKEQDKEDAQDKDEEDDKDGDSCRGQEQGEGRDKGNRAPQQTPKPQAHKPRQSLGEYYISHPPAACQRYSQGDPYDAHAQEWPDEWLDWEDSWEPHEDERQVPPPPKKVASCVLVVMLRQCALTCVLSLVLPSLSLVSYESCYGAGGTNHKEG
jgi:hypothetical protein